MDYCEDNSCCQFKYCISEILGKKKLGINFTLQFKHSMTLDKLYTTTTIEFSKKYEKFQVIINNETILGEEYSRVVNHLELLKNLTDYSSFAKVVSSSNFPKKAGLASSASGFAALTLAGSKALKLTLNEKELSILAIDITTSVDGVKLEIYNKKKREKES